MFIRGGETIAIKRRTKTGEDAVGQPEYSYAVQTVRDCLIAFGSTSEPTATDGTPEDVSLTLYLPPGTDVQPGDLFIVRQTEFVKDGIGQAWTSPFDGMPVGVVVPVRRRRG